MQNTFVVGFQYEKSEPEVSMEDKIKQVLVLVNKEGLLTKPKIYI